MHLFSSKQRPHTCSQLTVKLFQCCFHILILPFIVIEKIISNLKIYISFNNDVEEHFRRKEDVATLFAFYIAYMIKQKSSSAEGTIV